MASKLFILTSFMVYFLFHPRLGVIFSDYLNLKYKSRFTDQEYEILSIVFSAVDQIHEGKEPKQTIESLSKMADHEHLSEEYKI